MTYQNIFNKGIYFHKAIKNKKIILKSKTGTMILRNMYNQMLERRMMTKAMKTVPKD